jgi:hypothetical protein
MKYIRVEIDLNDVCWRINENVWNRKKDKLDRLIENDNVTLVT